MPPNRLTRQRSIVEIQAPVAGPSSSKRSKPRQQSAAAKPVVIHPDVIEISDSDDELIAPTLKRKIPEVLQLERQVKKLKQENEAHKKKESKLKEELVACKSDLTQLRSSAQPSTGAQSKNQIAVSDVEDSVTCEICTMKMWTPYILECGHSYCKSCLQDWFQTTLMQHMNTYPTYSINQPLQPPAYAFGFYGVPAYLNPATPDPQYTCPSCRKEVRHPPVEDFALKAVVRAVAKAQREESPRKEAAGSSRRKGKAPAVKENPWDGFFRKPQRT